MSVSSSYRASQVFVEMAGIKDQTGSDYLEPIGLILGQYDQDKTGIVDYTPVNLTSADAVGAKFGYGSEIHRQAIWVFGIMGGFSENLWFSPIPEPDSAVAAAGTITFVTDATSSGTYYLSIGGDVITFAVAKGDTVTEIAAKLVTAVTAELNALVTATNLAGVVTLTAKTAGVNGNDIQLVLNPSGLTQESDNPTGTTVSVDSYLADGAGVTDIHDTFFNSSEEDVLGDRWYTMISCPYNDSTNLGYIDDSWNVRKAAGFKRPFGVIIGYVNKTYDEYLTLLGDLNYEWMTPVWDPRSYSPANELAASTMGIVLESCKSDPGRPFKTLTTGIPLDTSVSDLSYVKNDALFRNGGSYFKTVVGEMVIGDLALSYRTNASGADTEEWFDLVSLTLRQQKVYEIETLFTTGDYIRGIVADDSNVSTKAYVIKPKRVIADMANLVDGWDSEGWTKNAATVKASITASINSTNNSRIDTGIIDDEAKALRIVSALYNFLF